MDYNAFINGTKPTKERVKIHMLRIGVLDAHLPQKMEMQKENHGQMMVIPPRLNGLQLKQQSFRESMEDFKCNNLLELENNSKENKDKDHDNGTDDEACDGKSDVDEQSNATSSTTTSNKKRKHNVIDVSELVTSGDDNMVKLDIDKSYPYLSRALGGEDGYDPTNPSVKRCLCGLLTELNKLLSTEYQLDVNCIPNNRISYGRVPRTQSDRSFLNSKEWVDPLKVDQCAGSGGMAGPLIGLGTAVILYIHRSGTTLGSPSRP
jgi:hypothetical protein